MANNHRGQASFEVDGATYTIAIDHNALAEAEDAADMPINDLLKAMHSAPRLKHFRAILFGGLREHHPDITLAAAGRLMGAGEVVGEAIAKAMRSAFPDPARVAPVGNEPSPHGTGKTSRPRGRKKD